MLPIVRDYMSYFHLAHFLLLISAIYRNRKPRIQQQIQHLFVIVVDP